MLREVTVKIGLERIDIQKEVIVEVLLDNNIIGLVISLKFCYMLSLSILKICSYSSIVIITSLT